MMDEKREGAVEGALFDEFCRCSLSAFVPALCISILHADSLRIHKLFFPPNITHITFLVLYHPFLFSASICIPPFHKQSLPLFEVASFFLVLTTIFEASHLSSALDALIFTFIWILLFVLSLAIFPARTSLTRRTALGSTFFASVS